MSLAQLAGLGACVLIVLALIVFVPWGFGSFQRTTKLERRWAREREENRGAPVKLQSIPVDQQWMEYMR